MSSYATKLAEAFSAKLLQQMYAKAITPYITNEDYSGDVQQGSLVNIPALGKITQKTYSGADLSPDDLTEIVAQLTVDQFKSFYFKVMSINLSLRIRPIRPFLSEHLSEGKTLMNFLWGFMEMWPRDTELGLTTIRERSLLLRGPEKWLGREQPLRVLWLEEDSRLSVILSGTE